MRLQIQILCCFGSFLIAPNSPSIYSGAHPGSAAAAAACTVNTYPLLLWQSLHLLLQPLAFLVFFLVVLSGHVQPKLQVLHLPLQLCHHRRVASFLLRLRFNDKSRSDSRGSSSDTEWNLHQDFLLIATISPNCPNVTVWNALNDQYIDRHFWVVLKYSNKKNPHFILMLNNWTV